MVLRESQVQEWKVEAWLMARREVIDCDRCGAKAVACPIHLCFDVDRVPDGAGGMEDVYSKIDLCVRCATSALHELIGKMDHAGRRIWGRDIIEKGSGR